MALRKEINVESSGPVTQVGKFEQMDEAVSSAPAANETKSTQVVVAQSTALAALTTAGNGDIRCDLEMLRDQMGTQLVESLGIGAFPRVTVGLDGFSIKDGHDLGKKIRLAVDSWNYVYMVTTGENSSPETNKLIRTSYDGVNLQKNGPTVADYLKTLKDVEGYTKASVRQYVEIYGDLVWSADKGEVAEDDRKTVQVSLSPQSVVQMSAFFVDSRKRKRKGINDGNMIYLTQEKKVIGALKFGIATFSAK